MTKSKESQRLYMQQYRAQGRDKSTRVQSAANNKVLVKFKADHPQEWRQILHETWDEMYPKHEEES